MTTMKTHSVMTFTGNDGVPHRESARAYDPPMMNMSESKSSLDGKWVGACTPGQQPGDITLESGQTINITSMIRK